MSCESKINHIGKTAAKNAGIATLVGKAGHIQTLMSASVQASIPSVRKTLSKSQAAIQKGQVILAQASAVAGYTAGIAGPENRSPEQQRAARRVILGAKGTLAALTFYNPGMLVAYYLTKKAQAVGTLAGSTAAGFTRSADAGLIRQQRREFFLFKREEEVPLWHSKLSSWLNRRDLMVQPEKVISSQGVMFKSGAMTWHQGTTTLQMADGLRTISHLQSLSLPASHFYFDKRLSDEHAVALATGKVKAESVPGFIGHVSAFEGLSPIWAMTKHWLIKSYLFYGPRTMSPIQGHS